MNGASKDKIQQRKNNNLWAIVSAFREIYLHSDQLDNSKYFSPDILFMRSKSISGFEQYLPELKRKTLHKCNWWSRAL